jgi:hypothetical protein
MGATVLRGDDLDVLGLTAAIRLLVLDADVGEVDLVIEVRQVVFVRPFANLVGRSTCTFAMGFKIERGKFREVPLDGLGFIVVGFTPEEMGKGNWSAGVARKS